MSSKGWNVNASQIQATNNSSIVSKCSMASKNYVNDEFVRYFVHKKKTRTSLINLGYSTRAIIFEQIVTRFIEFLNFQKLYQFQIISCGAGFDTTYWRLTEDGLLNDETLFIEIDFPDVIKRKIILINRSQILKSYIDKPETIDESIEKLKQNFYMFSCDLSDIKKLEDNFKKIDVDFNVPTLFLSECVITYMRVDDSNNLVLWIARKFPNSSFINYEQISPDDGFGSVMLKHFDDRGSRLYSVLHFPDLKSHEKRYKLLGFDHAIALSEWQCFLLFTDEKERERLLTLEQFDEFEEFHQKCSHYTVAAASKNVLGYWMNFLFEYKQKIPRVIAKRNCFDFERGEEIFELFGHTSCTVGTDTVLIFGGFNRKGRSKKVHKYYRGVFSEINVSANEYNKLDIIRGSAVSYEMNDRTYVGIYGGRTSPNNVANGGNFLIMEYNENTLIFQKSFKFNNTPRYRHSITCQNYLPNRVSLWVYGGRTADLQERLPELSQCIIYPDGNDSFSMAWMNKTSKTPAPCARMSHSAVLSPPHGALFISCGLDAENFTALNDLWKWSISREYWERIEIKHGNLIPRYGHTSHIRDNVLLLIGGVNTTSECQPGLALINLRTFHCIELALQPFRSDPILLFNHTSAIMEERGEPKIFIFGGGGNCFTFGTYFNKTVMKIPFRQFARPS